MCLGSGLKDGIEMLDGGKVRDGDGEVRGEAGGIWRFGVRTLVNGRVKITRYKGRLHTQGKTLPFSCGTAYAMRQMEWTPRLMMISAAPGGSEPGPRLSYTKYVRFDWIMPELRSMWYLGNALARREEWKQAVRRRSEKVNGVCSGAHLEVVCS